MNNRSENAQSSSQKMSTENISEILDKMLKLQEKEKKPSFFKKTICIVASICVVIFVIFICIIIHKNNFTTESILSTLLAFFWSGRISFAKRQRDMVCRCLVE